MTNDIPATNKPTGHERLIADIERIMKEAIEFEFDDIRNTTYATPKTELITKLSLMIDKCKAGFYDQ